MATQLAAYRSRSGRRGQIAPRPLPAIAEWHSALTTLRGLRRNAIG